MSKFIDATPYNHREAFANLAPSEIIAPSHPIFALQGEETIVYDKRSHPVSRQRLLYAITNHIITEFDKKTLCQIALFTDGITTKMLSEILVLKGDAPNEKVRDLVNKSVYRLWNYGLIDTLRFVAGNEKASNTRLLMLAPSGWQLVRSWGGSIGGYYNALNIATRNVAEHKRYAASAQVVTAWLKHIPCASFVMRPTVKDYVVQQSDAIVRPSALINVGNVDACESIFVETVRRTENNADELLQKLYRYNLVLSYMEKTPALLIVGEDEAHTRILHDYLVAHGANMDNIAAYTHDLAIAGDFWNAFYTFESGNRIQLHIA